MSKSKKGKIIQLKSAQLSPEKYIKTQARSLPIYECLISEGWEDAGICNVVVTRKHKTGNITVGIYLIDMFLLGLKDTHYQFNITPGEYDDLGYNNAAMEKCDYVLAHNIIYGAIAYAEDYGFKPYKDFAVTQFILEEDDERVELMEIEFGLDGMPCFMPGPYDDAAKIKSITATLERTAGPGNFEIYDEDEEFDDDEFDEDDLIDELEESYARYPKILKKLNKVYDGLVRDGDSKEKIEKSPIGKTYQISKTEVKTGYNKLENAEQEAAYQQFREIITESEDYKPVIKDLKKAIIKYPDVPLFYDLLYTVYGFDEQFDKVEEVILEMYKRFPEYLYAMVVYANLLIDTDKLDEVLTVFKGKLDLNELYPDRKKFYNIEAATYYACMCRYFIGMNDIDSADLYMNAILKKELYKLQQQTLVTSAVIEMCNAKMKVIGEISGFGKNFSDQV
jgi:hypothetical protein